MTCLHRPSGPSKKAPEILTDGCFHKVGACQTLPLLEQAMKSWEAPEPQRTWHFMAKIYDHISKAANYSSKEPELSEHSWKEG